MNPESIIIMISEPGRANKKKNCPSRILKQSVFVPAAGRHGFFKSNFEVRESLINLET